MAGITVFDTYEQADPTLAKLSEDNEKALERLSEIGEEKEREYRQQTGYDDRLREQQKGDISPINPSIIALPEDEYQRVWADAGKGLEFICAVSLSAYGATYSFSGDGMSQYPTDNDYTTIKELVDSVKGYLAQLNTAYYGATIEPFVYTIAEEITLGDEGKQGLQESRRQLDGFGAEELTDLEEEDLTPEDKKAMGDFISAMLASADVPVRGLNAEERAEFERLFYSQ